MPESKQLSCAIVGLDFSISAARGTCTNAKYRHFLFLPFSRFDRVCFRARKLLQRDGKGDDMSEGEWAEVQLELIRQVNKKRKQRGENTGLEYYEDASAFADDVSHQFVPEHIPKYVKHVRFCDDNCFWSRKCVVLFALM